MTPLFPYQDTAVSKIKGKLSSQGFHMLDADMGTGKTLMSLAVSLDYPRTIILAPKSLVSNWEAEIERNTGQRSLVWESQKWGTAKYQRQIENFTSPYIIVNIESFGHRNEKLEMFFSRFITGEYLVIYDESSRLKDQGAHRTKYVAKIFGPKGKKLAMTGTMNANSPLDVYGQFLCLSSSFWPSKGFRTWFLFRKYFALLEDIYVQGGRVVKGGRIVGYRKMDQLASMIAPHVTSIRKKDVLDLPEKVFNRISVQLSDKEEKAYSDLKRKMMTTLSSGETVAVDQKIALYHKFRMLCGGWVETGTMVTPVPAKLLALVDFLESSDEQFLIFAVYTHEIVQICQTIEGAKRYDGSVPVDERAQLVRDFNDRKFPYLVLQPMAGAFGLNLQTSCNNVIYYSRPNSPEVWEQSQDRVHRIGQEKTCFYWDFVAKGRIDEKVIEALENHEDLSKMFSQISLKAIDKFIGA